MLPNAPNGDDPPRGAPMRARAMVVTLAAAAASLVSVGWSAAPAAAATTCVWGGTPAAPTGQFVIDPGVTNTPAPAPLRFKAWGPAVGEACDDTVTFTGGIPAGSNCAVLQFEGRVKGIPGVARFWGPGTAAMTHEWLYDKNGNIVGFDNPTILNQFFVERLASNPNVCNTPEGFTHGRFSATITLFE
jgi:hypothetical protein